MPAAWAAGISAVVGAASAASSADASRKAAHGQQDAARDATAQQRADQAPWMEAGTEALSTLRAGLQPGGEFTKKFTMADATNSPAEQEAMRGGSEAIQNSAASKGGLIGTNTMQDLTKFGAANAAQYQNQAFNQWNAEQNRKLGATQSLAQVGQTAVTGVADNTSNLTLAGANAGAAGTIGKSNAIGNGAGNLTNQISMLSGLFGTSGSNPVPAGGDASGVGMPMAMDISTGSTYMPSQNYGG
jgi:hypothetical protein